MVAIVSKKQVIQALMIILAAMLAWPMVPQAFAAFERSSKKECALCHIMWMDDFRTDKETLIQWQPGNVLMKDTQGIVSAEQVCYSCHDGYVVDSRFSVWKDHNHPTFIKPSKDVTVPDALPLSNKGEIYCGTCHSPHSGRESTPGASPEETIPGPLAFLRLPDINSSLCETCHAAKADFHRTNGHPLHVDTMPIPQALFEQGSVQAERRDTIICETCHKNHGAKGSHITVVDNNQSGLCEICHKERTISGTPHDAPDAMHENKYFTRPAVSQSSVSQSGPCSVCHGVHQSTGFKLLNFQSSGGNPATQICLGCHSGEAGSRTKSIGRFSHPMGLAAAVESMASDKAAPTPGQGGLSTGNLPLFDQNGHQQPLGTIQCFTCHNIHQWDPNDPQNRGGRDARGDASNSFLRLSAAEDSDLCTTCHADKRQLLAYDHNLRLSAPQATNIRHERAQVSGACGACHLPHNAMGNRLWARDVLLDQDGAPQYCTSCHSETGPAKGKRVGGHDHPINMAIKSTQTPSPSLINDSLPLFYPDGEKTGGDRVICRTCHDVHIWSAADDRPASGMALEDGANRQKKSVSHNQEGDARNSFLRIPASPEPGLCVTCHPDTGLIVGTDHDLLVTAPTALNQLNQTAIQSGQCGVCHAAHNSPHQRLQWAQALPEVDESQHPMDGLCLGCHSTAGAAANKVPPVATHPKGQLINNILTFQPKSRNFIMLFDDNWEQVNVGDLSCSSCHSFYQWDHRSAKPGPGINVEGDADTSFLRTSSDKTVCIDCHGQSAIWRYLYYHSIQKRAMIEGRQP